MTSLESTYAAIYRDYLAQDLAAALLASHGAVWPPATVERVAPEDEAPAAVPCIAVYAVEEEGRHPQLSRLIIHVQLKVGLHHEPASESDPFGTARSTAQQWFAALQIALADAAALGAYIRTLAISARTGGNILLRTIDGIVRHEVSTEERTETYELTIRHDIDISPP